MAGFDTSRNCWRVARADSFGWCVDGEDYFAAVRDAIGRAEREILIVGWDIDSRVELIRDENHEHYPSALCETLQQLVDATDELCVRVLSWDFAVVYVLERELMPARAFGWKESERLHFHLDGEHPTGASHHQKIVIVDGALAFSGGLDLTKCRWDTRAHAADDPRRTSPGGDAYRPFHDVQAVVTGDAAHALRELVSNRWQNATGEPLPELDEAGDADAPWPADVAVRARDVDVAIARTWVIGDERIQEVKALYLEMIAAAETSIYVENQYFTSVSISEALAERLAEEHGPELVVVLPGETSGWLEQATMDILRNQAIARLAKADRYNRLRILTPESEELGDTKINVHSKIMVVDNRIARIGSANLSRRSMGLDTECDLVVEDEDAATALCADLLGEHLDADCDEVAASLAGAGLIATIEKFNGGPRRLDPLEIGASEIEQAVLEPVAKIADLEKPIIASGDDAGPGMHAPVAGWLFLGLVALVIAFWVYWAVSASGDEFDVWALLARLRELASHPAAPFAVLPAFVAGSLMVAPVIGMIALCALLFDPWVASVTALAGTLAATAVNHWLGSRFHGTLMHRVPDRITDRIAAIADSSDMWSLAGLRLIPIAPFSIVNLVVGASGVRLRDFLLGTIIAMAPGIVLIALSVDRARAALAGEPVFDPWIGVGIIVAGIAMIALRAWKKRRQPD
ncbi:MAG: phospholipase D-like domain-containing protein [Woeseiaceae bacterium]|nr:phospholipase D-like domain-containing protein [Woeseiaceae bacterium]